jgi:hypothetical protein
MSTLHTIRLRGPWTAAIAGREPMRVTVPGSMAELGLPDVRGPVSFYRRFGRPGNAEGKFDPAEALFLVAPPLPGLVAASLNGVGLSLTAQGFDARITDLLHDRNELRLDFDITESSQGPIGEIRLEIRLASCMPERSDKPEA